MVEPLLPPPLLRRMMDSEAPESAPDLVPDRWVELDEPAERAPSTIPSPPPSETLRCPVSQPPSICPECGQPNRIVSSSVLELRPPEGT